MYWFIFSWKSSPFLVFVDVCICTISVVRASTSRKANISRVRTTTNREKNWTSSILTAGDSLLCLFTGPKIDHSKGADLAMETLGDMEVVLIINSIVGAPVVVVLCSLNHIHPFSNARFQTHLIFLPGTHLKENHISIWLSNWGDLEERLADQVKAPEGNVGGEGLNGQWGT